MKNTKNSFPLFSFYDRTGIEAYLERQAKHGWMLKKISALGWQFRWVEPCRVHFSVVYYAKASAFDPEPSEGQLTLCDFCEHTGWHLAASNAQMQIFYNEAQEPTPIETDAALEVQTIHTAAKKSHLLSYYLLAGVGLLQAVLFFARLTSNPVDVLASNASLFTGFCWMMMLLLSGIELAGYYCWYRRARTAAAINGSFVETHGHRNFQLILVLVMLLAFAFMLISYGGSGFSLIAFATTGAILGVTAIVVCVSELMKKWKLSAGLNRSITIALTFVLSFAFTGALLFFVIDSMTSLMPHKEPIETYEYNGWEWEIYHDDLPLTLEQLINTEYDGYSYEIRTANHSLLIDHTEAWQRPRMDALAQPDLEYSVTVIKVPFLYAWCKQALLDNFAHNYGYPDPMDDMWKEHVAIDAAPWGADEAYQLRLGGDLQMRFLLCYRDRIVEIDFEWDWTLTDEQMQTIGDLLGK